MENHTIKKKQRAWQEHHKHAKEALEAIVLNAMKTEDGMSIANYTYCGKKYDALLIHGEVTAVIVLSYELFLFNCDTYEFPIMSH